jgi:predicted nucleic acid-binding Zn ribbon protein
MVATDVCIMKIRRCPNCKKNIPTSWYVYSGWRDSYRCVSCLTLLEWNKRRQTGFTLFFFILLFLFVYQDLMGEHSTYFWLVFIAFSFLVNYLTPATYLVKVAEDKTRATLEALDSHDDSGCGVITLSLETGISQQSLRKVFRKHKKYCISLNGISTFKLNKLTEENGSVDKMIRSIEQQKVEDRVSNALLLAFVLGLCIPNIDTVIALLL